MTQSQPHRAFPSTGRLLGLDHGTRRMGIAVSDAEQTLAGPLDNYDRRGEEQDARHLRRIVSEYRIAGVVVGLPVHMSGDEGGQARGARAFGQWVAEVTELPVCFWDERYTSADAEEHLLAAELSKKKRKARRDMLAAQLMLQSFLNAEDRTRAPESM